MNKFIPYGHPYGVIPTKRSDLTTEGRNPKIRFAKLEWGSTPKVMTFSYLQTINIESQVSLTLCIEIFYLRENYDV